MQDRTNPTEQWLKEFAQCVYQIHKQQLAFNALSGYKNANIELMRRQISRNIKEWIRVRDNLITELGAGLYFPDSGGEN